MLEVGYEAPGSIAGRGMKGEGWRVWKVTFGAPEGEPPVVVCEVEGIQSSWGEAGVENPRETRVIYGWLQTVWSRCFSTASFSVCWFGIFKGSQRETTHLGVVVNRVSD